jgi:hypothetical protein
MPVPNDSHTNGVGDGDGGGFDDAGEITHVEDAAQLYCTNLGLSVSEGGRRIANLGGKLAPHGSARRRASLLGFLEEIDVVIGALELAKSIIREHAGDAYEHKDEAT